MQKSAIISILVVLALVLGLVWALNRDVPLNKDMADTYGSGQNTEDKKEETNNNINNEDTEKTMEAILHTNKGDITIELFSDRAPNTVANFTKLAKEGFYDGVKFHRVIKGFMIQGGDPLTKDDSKSDFWGTGGPGYKFADEIYAGNRNDIGTISMANAGPDTNGSQFFINTAANNFLDGKHTVFGKVTSGMEVVKAIEVTPTGTAGRPITPVVISSVTIK